MLCLTVLVPPTKKALSSDDHLIIGDAFTMAFGAPPLEHESAVPWNGPEQHYIGVTPVQLEMAQQAATTELHARMGPRRTEPRQWQVNRCHLMRNGARRREPRQVHLTTARRRKKRKAPLWHF